MDFNRIALKSYLRSSGEIRRTGQKVISKQKEKTVDRGHVKGTALCQGKHFSNKLSAKDTDKSLGMEGAGERQDVFLQVINTNQV